MAVTKVVKVKRSAKERISVTPIDLLYLNNLILYHAVKINYQSFLQKAGVPYYSDMGGTSVIETASGRPIIDKRWKPLSKKTIERKRRKGYLYGGVVAINIRTRLLLNALKPGKFINGKYIGLPNQRYSVTQSRIEFWVTVPYADAVNQVRNIYVLDMDALIGEALERSWQQFQRYLNQKNR